MVWLIDGWLLGLLIRQTICLHNENLLKTFPDVVHFILSALDALWLQDCKKYIHLKLSKKIKKIIMDQKGFQNAEFI